MITLRNTLAAAILNFINQQFDAAGFEEATLQIMSGTRPQYPESPNIDGALLAVFVLPNPAFKNANMGGGMAVASAWLENLPEPNAVNSGNATWFRMIDQNGVALLDGSVSDEAGNGDLKLQQTSLIAGRPVKVASWLTRYPQ